MSESENFIIDTTVKCTNCDDECHCGTSNGPCDKCYCDNEFYKINPQYKTINN